MEVDFFCPECGAAHSNGSTSCSFCKASLVVTTPAETRDLRIHTLLKQRYEILEKVGQGGFGAVYKAKDLLFSSALRAIKEMDDHQLSPQERQEAIAAFRREAHMLARLMHPNLPRIYDHFEEQQRWYLVMDYVDGRTLDHVLSKSPEGKLPVEQVVQYALQLCKVLHYLHTQTPPIIFRDLKPTNILVTDEDHVYLIDFGIARLFKPGKEKDTVALGSPGYAAPEQFGKAQTTAQADIYSLGATLHHLLSGRDPSETPFIFPLLQLEARNSMTEALADLVRQMVAIEKEKRPANVQEVQQVLTTLQQAKQMEQSQPVVSPIPQTNIPPSSSKPVQPQPIVSLQTNIPPSLSKPAQPQTNILPPVKSSNYIGPQGHRKWTFRTGGLVTSSPTVANGIVYFGSNDYNLYALDAASGQQQWSFLTGKEVYSSPTVANGIVYFGSMDGKIYALNASSGEQTWFFHTKKEVVSSPTVVNNTVYFGSYTGNLYALNATSGQQMWSFRTSKEVASSPTIINNVVYFGSNDGNFYAVYA